MDFRKFPVKPICRQRWLNSPGRPQDFQAESGNYRKGKDGRMDKYRNPETIWGSLVENIALCFKQCQRIRKSLWFKQEDKQRTNHTAKDFEINLYTYPTSAGFCRSTLWMVYVRMFIIKRDQVPQPLRGMDIPRQGTEGNMTITIRI